MRGLALGCSVVAAFFLTVVLLRPVLLAPVTGDDVYYSLRAAADPDRSVLTEIRALPLELRNRVDRGRVSALTAAERRTAGRAMLDTAVDTGRPTHQVLAVLRVGYAALSLFAVYALLRSVRWRLRGSGELVPLGTRTRTVALVTGTLAFAVGARPELVGNDGWNGWVAYPVLTWTAAFSIFGVVALALWLARWSAASRSRVKGAVAALLFVVVGVVTNFRSELAFVALPLTLVALAVVPVTDRHRRAVGRRATWLVGSAYVAGFVPLFVANRLLVSDVCATGGCYEGVSLSLRPVMARTFANNVISSIPGTSGDESLALLRAASISTQGAWVPTAWSVLAALGLVATLALVWRGALHRSEPDADPEERRAEAVLCLIGAGVLVLGALGAAAVMSMSRRAQEDMSEVGILYRHSVVTWTGLAFSVVLLVLAVGLWRPRLATPGFVALGLVMAALVATKLPADARMMVANTDRMRPSIDVFAEIVRGESSESANQRRCRTLRDVTRESSEFDARNIRRTSQQAFERYWQTPFCVRR